MYIGDTFVSIGDTLVSATGRSTLDPRLSMELLSPSASIEIFSIFHPGLTSCSCRIAIRELFKKIICSHGKVLIVF